MFTRGAWAGPSLHGTKDVASTTRRLLDRLRPERRLGIAVLGIACASVALTVYGPKLLGRATDVIVTGVLSPEGIDFAELRAVLLFVLAVYAAGAALASVQTYVLAGVVQRTMHRLRADVEDKINRLPLGYVDRTPRGDLLSRVTNDIDNMAMSLQQAMSQLLNATLTVVGITVMIVVISPLLAVFALVLIPTSTILVKLLGKFSMGRFIGQWMHTGQLNAQVEETFTGHHLVKVFGHQQDAEDRFGETNDQLFDSSFRAQFVVGIVQPALMLIGNLHYVAVAVVGGLRVAAGAVSIGDVQALTQYARQLNMPLQQLGGMMNMMQSGIASAERVFELLDAPEEEADPSDAAPFEATSGRVEFAHVSFSYEPGVPLIEDLSLVAEPGKTVAIVGPTGAGKTTLVNLIMRFYDLDGGVITVDGVDIACVRRQDLRAAIGMVLQDTWLFEGTIFDNIAYGNLDATPDDVLAAARAAYVDRFVQSLPDGYDTVIDEDGGNLSSGEVQLITIARAFLADPTILILDEATSSVDTRTEVLVQHAMAALRSQRTSFVIAHRLSTIRDADLVLVMDGGKIVEQGTHDELIARRGAYFVLYDAQFRAPAAEADPLALDGTGDTSLAPAQG
jgi:ATP-binding cassette subfamily B protein